MPGEKLADVRLEKVVTATYSLLLDMGLVVAWLSVLRVSTAEFIFAFVLSFLFTGAFRGAFWPTDDDGLRKVAKGATLLDSELRPEPAAETRRNALLVAVLAAGFAAATLFGLGRTFGIDGFALGLMAGGIAAESLAGLREAAWVAKWQKRTGRVLVRKRGFRLSRKEPTYFYLQPLGYEVPTTEAEPVDSRASA